MPEPVPGYAAAEVSRNRLIADLANVDRETATRLGYDLPRDPCPTCGGDGEVLVEFVFGMQMQDCLDCAGTGTVDDPTC